MDLNKIYIVYADGEPVAAFGVKDQAHNWAASYTDIYGEDMYVEAVKFYGPK